jgi:predicted nucleic acid-binding protein
MTAKVFVDSRILVYAHDADAGPKQKPAAAQIKALWEEELGRISTQVLQEFYVTVTQKLRKTVSQEQSPRGLIGLVAADCTVTGSCASFLNPLQPRLDRLGLFVAEFDGQGHCAGTLSA